MGPIGGIWERFRNNLGHYGQLRVDLRSVGAIFWADSGGGDSKPIAGTIGGRFMADWGIWARFGTRFGGNSKLIEGNFLGQLGG